MESLGVTLQALVLLVVALGLIIGSLIVNPAYTVMLAVFLVVVVSLALLRIMMNPAG